MDEQMGGRTDGWMNRWVEEQIGGRTDGWMDEQMD